MHALKLGNTEAGQCVQTLSTEWVSNCAFSPDDKIVALKVLSHHLRDDEEFVTRFHTEARAASRLDHPNSTRVLDFGAEPDA